MRAPRRSLALAAGALLAGCGAASTDAPPVAPRLPAGVRPIGPGARFHPGLVDRPVAGCRAGLGPRVGAHVELFARGLVVLFPAGIGTRPPRRLSTGRIAHAGCYGPLVTIDPTGLVLLRPGTHATVGDLFAVWGRPLGRGGTAGFAGRVRAWVDGRRRHGPAASVPLRRHAEIVLEVGPYVPPHRRYAFPEGF